MAQNGIYISDHVPGCELRYKIRPDGIVVVTLPNPLDGSVGSGDKGAANLLKPLFVSLQSNGEVKHGFLLDFSKVQQITPDILVLLSAASTAMLRYQLFTAGFGFNEAVGKFIKPIAMFVQQFDTEEQAAKSGLTG